LFFAAWIAVVSQRIDLKFNGFKGIDRHHKPAVDRRLAERGQLVV
jgi:hypothetical protein